MQTILGVGETLPCVSICEGDLEVKNGDNHL